MIRKINLIYQKSNLFIFFSEEYTNKWVQNQIVESVIEIDSIETISSTTHSSIRKKSPKKVEKQTPKQSQNIYEPIDTSKLMHLLKTTLSSHRISEKFFSNRVLAMSQSASQNLLKEKPPHWTKCTREEKAACRRIQTWLNTKNAPRTLKAVQEQSSNRRRSVRLLFKPNNGIASPGFLNTAAVAQKTNELLNKRDMKRSTLAKEFLHLNPYTLWLLLTKPKVWSMCSKTERDVYRRLHNWIAHEETEL